MFTRIAIIACTLCLAVPTAAGASPGSRLFETAAAKGPYGPTVAGSLPNPVKARGPYGMTSAGTLPDAVKAKGPYGMTSARPLTNAVAARGPYGITVDASAKPDATSTTRGTAAGDDTDDWRTAAILEAVLLAILGLGAALVVAPRRRAPRVGV